MSCTIQTIYFLVGSVGLQSKPSANMLLAWQITFYIKCRLQIFVTRYKGRVVFCFSRQLAGSWSVALQLLLRWTPPPLAHHTAEQSWSTAAGASAALPPTSFLLLLLSPQLVSCHFSGAVMVSVFLCRLFVCVPARLVVGPMPGTGSLVWGLKPENAIRRSVLFVIGIFQIILLRETFWMRFEFALSEFLKQINGH